MNSYFKPLNASFCFCLWLFDNHSVLKKIILISSDSIHWLFMSNYYIFFFNSYEVLKMNQCFDADLPAELSYCICVSGPQFSIVIYFWDVAISTPINF